MRHNFNIQYVLDVKKTKNPRLFFLELEGRNTMNHTITVERDRQFCRTVQVSIRLSLMYDLNSFCKRKKTDNFCILKGLCDS